MALIKCPECGKEISDKAKTCPNCGISMDDIIALKKVKKCPECGGEIKGDEHECPRCGFPLKEEQKGTIMFDEVVKKDSDDVSSTKEKSLTAINEVNYKNSDDETKKRYIVALGVVAIIIVIAFSISGGGGKRTKKDYCDWCGRYVKLSQTTDADTQKKVWLCDFCNTINHELELEYQKYGY